MLTREEMMARLTTAAQTDPRIVGLIDYGSSSEGTADEWSDVDVALFLEDAALPVFEANWRSWADQFGELLLAYISGVGHPWCVYAGTPLPLRVDFNFLPLSQARVVTGWPKSVRHPTDLLLYDAGGTLSEWVRPLVGQSLAPVDSEAAFETAAGDFWYYTLRTLGKLKREQAWLARWEFNFIIIGNLTALLRLESGALSRWRASHAVADIETAVPPHRLAQLNNCIPGPGLEEVQRVLRAAAHLGHDVCSAIERKEGWSWSRALADRILVAFASIF